MSLCTLYCRNLLRFQILIRRKNAYYNNFYVYELVTVNWKKIPNGPFSYSGSHISCKLHRVLYSGLVCSESHPYVCMVRERVSEMILQRDTAVRSCVFVRKANSFIIVFMVPSVLGPRLVESVGGVDDSFYQRECIISISLQVG